MLLYIYDYLHFVFVKMEILIYILNSRIYMNEQHPKIENFDIKKAEKFVWEV